MITVYWTHPDRDASIECGDYETESEAMADLPEIKREMLDQCGYCDDESGRECRDSIENGTFDAEDDERHTWKLADGWEIK